MGTLRDYRRLLATPLGTGLLRIELAMDLYARNPFRMLAVPAWLGDEQRDALIQRFRNLYKLRPEAALKDVLRLGYEEFVEISDHLRLLNDLCEPQRRLVWELFWPHVSQDTFDRISADRILNIPKKDAASSATEKITTVKDIMRLSEGELSEVRVQKAQKEEDLSSTPSATADSAVVQHETSPREAALWTHTLAILHHNRALAIEFSLGSAANEPAYTKVYRAGADEHWRKSFEYWAATTENPAFWEYLKERVTILDDPQLQPSHLESLREDLPAAILAFNATLLRAYVGADCMEDAARQMRLIGNNLFHLPTQQAITVGLLREVANAWLNPLIQQLGNQHPHRKCPWQEVRNWLMPILESAEQLAQEIKEKFAVDEMTMAEMRFDNLAERVLEGIGPEVVEDQPFPRRMLLLLILLCRRLLALPLSTPLQRTIEGRRGEYLEHLYGRFYENPSDARQLDPSECWFLPGEWADPEFSLLLPVRKETSGKSATTSTEEVLIPRSVLAETFHMGKIPFSSLRDQRQSEVERITTLVAGFRSDVDSDRKRLETACAEAIAQEQGYCQTRMKGFDEEIAPLESAMRAEVQKIEAVFQPRFAEVDARSTVARATVTERWTSALGAAHKALAQFEPMHRTVQFTLPLVGLLVASVAISLSAFSAANAFTFQYLTSIESILRDRFYASDRMLSYLPIVVAVLLSVVLAVVLAEVILSGQARSARRSLEKLTTRQEEDLAWVDQMAQKQRATVLSEQEAQLSDQRTQLAAILQRREDFAREMNQILHDVRNRHQQEIDRRQAVVENRFASLTQHLAAYQHPPKTPDDKSDFPAYLEAMRLGYQPCDRLPKPTGKTFNKQTVKQNVAKLWPF